MTAWLIGFSDADRFGFVILSEFNRKPPDTIEVYRGIKIIGPKCILELLSS